jgi:hypothetical protein
VALAETRVSAEPLAGLAEPPPPQAASSSALELTARAVFSEMVCMGCLRRLAVSRP